jgi:hypothetical protein
MSSRERSHELRLGVAFEAEALICGMGAEAYGVARRRAEESSSAAMARDWESVAATIARKTRRRSPSLLAAMFH